MKLAFALTALLAAAVTLSAAGCSSSAHPRKDARSRATCEQLLRHSFQLQLDVSTLALDDHDYQRRKIEADLKRQEEELKNSSTFLQSCNSLTSAEYDCMTRAADWYSYTACYAPKDGNATALSDDPASDAAATGSSAATEETSAEGSGDAPAPPPPCPAIANPGRGLATITGKVRSDDASAAPQADFSVVLTAGGPESHGEAITDAQGRFTFDRIEPGTYEVSAMQGALEGSKRCIAVLGGSTTPVEILVHIPPEPPSEVIILDPGKKPAKKAR